MIFHGYMGTLIITFSLHISATHTETIGKALDKLSATYSNIIVLADFHIEQ